LWHRPIKDDGPVREQLEDQLDLLGNGQLAVRDEGPGHREADGGGLVVEMTVADGGERGLDIDVFTIYMDIHVICPSWGLFGPEGRSRRPPDSCLCDYVSEGQVSETKRKTPG
jgi:hypothetical protein